MRFLIISDIFSLETWLTHDQQPQTMPAVYNWFQFLGHHDNHTFHAIIVHPGTPKSLTFPNGSTIQLIQLNIPYHYMRKFCSLFYLYTKAIRLCQKNDFDLVYGMGVYSTLASVIGNKLNLFSISRIFGSLVYDILNKRQFAKLYIRYILQYMEIKWNSNLIICTEDGTQFDLAAARINPDANVLMLYNGLDPEMRQLLLNLPIPEIRGHTQPINMLSSGRLVQWKRHDLAIQFLSILKNRYNWKNVKLTILGKGPRENTLRKLAQSLNLQNEVEFMEPVPHKEIPSLLNGYHIFLSFYDASNLSNAMWEAAMSGRIICTRPTGKTLQIFQHLNNSLISEDLNQLAEDLNHLDTSNFNQICSNARDKINRLIPDWENRFQLEIESIMHAMSQYPLRKV